MNIKETIKKIKTYLEDETKSENLIDVKTKDGIILNYDGELVIGVEIFIVDEEGKTPAPDGEYILDDDTKIMIVDGKITEIEKPVEETPETPETTVEDAPIEEDMENEKLSIEDLNVKIENLEKENLEIKETLTTILGFFTKKEFEKEVKASAIEEKEELKVELKVEQKPLNKMNNQLNTIFKNMYK